ncbi:MAG: hypothetical protein RRY64_03680 [Oscillospiraceae bacterium]
MMDMSSLIFENIRIGQMRDRIANKKEENRNKPKLHSNDVLLTMDFNYAVFSDEGDSGQLLLATCKQNPSQRYVVKHQFTDCACNEFIYAKLLQAMDCHVPETKLFQLSPNEKRDIFLTEYVVGSHLLNVVDPVPSYETIREEAANWTEYFSFYGFYALTGESDGMETPLANDGYIYRIDTTDAFPISSIQLDCAGIARVVNGVSIKELIKKDLLEKSLDSVLPVTACDFCWNACREKDAAAFKKPFLAPFLQIQEISEGYIDDFLNTLCYFYPDFIGDYFKRYITALQKQCAEYAKEKR